MTRLRGYKASKLSPTSLAPFDDAEALMIQDGILDHDFYTSLEGEAQTEMYRCILFVYGFMQANHWVATRIDFSSGQKEHEFVPLTNPHAQNRIELVLSMTNTVNGCRTRLLQIANAEGDEDLTVGAKNLETFENYVRCLLRFFLKQGSFGFKDDMSDVVHSLCIQSVENCQLITACELVDLILQKDLPLSDTEMYQCLDKSQVARRTMSPNDLVGYVVNNSGNCGQEVIERLLGKEDVLSTHLHTDTHFKNAIGIETMLSLLMRREKLGPCLITFSVEGFVVPEERQRNQGTCEIPCFDAFDREPVKYLKLDNLVENEEELVQKQLQTGKNQRPHTLGPRGVLSFVEGGIPHLQDSDLSTSTSSLDIPYGDSEDSAPDSSWFGGFQGISNAPKGTVFGTEERGGTENSWRHLDKTAATPNASENCGRASGKRHSVVMIGGYDDDDGKTWYLMKNSWLKLPLFLASAECLAKFDTNAAFFKSKLSELPTNYVRTNKRFTACSSPIVNGEGSFKRIVDPFAFVSGP